ncbi:MAG: hypothetical protein ABIS50_07840 [Luteolibacter sp.]|uniref:hypothetical protein n=1 Tax=Luteolibacter sp. TaxID=1962973 RepID=UPI003263E433
MSRTTFFKEDQELHELRASQQALLLREKDVAEIPKRLAREQRERESTMPPLPEIEDRRRRREHENTVSRGEAKNILRDQNRSLMLLFLLLTATAALVWWGLKLMQA